MKAKDLEEIYKEDDWKINFLSEPKTGPPFCYFRDGIRRVHFVLAYTNKTITEEISNKTINTFISNLEENGLEFEMEFAKNNLTFIKVHASRNVLLHFANVYDIDLAFQTHYYRPEVNVPFKWMSTEVLIPNLDGPVFKRAPYAVSGERPVNITSCEAIQIVYKLMSHARYGDNKMDRGIKKLLKRKIFNAAFPLHDGLWNWTDEGAITDRQLLAHFWANAKSWYKQQPLDLIEKYFGSEVAFYFAWLGFYNKMLIPAAIIGTICFCFGLFTLTTTLNMRSKEICNSNLVLCPLCHNCKYFYLKASCTYARLTYLFDNFATIVFAIIMAFWATLFMELWKRQQAVLQIRWNVTSVETDTNIRWEYEENTPYRKISSVTGNLEPYVPKKIKFCRYVITYITILLLMCCMIAGIVSLIIYRLSLLFLMTKSYGETIVKKNMALLITISSALITVIFIIIFGFIYKKIAIWLTNMENHRTQSEFDNSYIYKCYVLGFVNNYSVIIYIAFFKGRFYTYPGDKSWQILGGLQTDLCDPSGCIIDLCIQLFIIMIVKNVFTSIVEILRPTISIVIKKFLNKTTDSTCPMEQWEIDYSLNPVADYFLINEYMEMVIQYGFVIFFVAAFPLAPLLALVNNIAEIRIDSFKFVRAHRRPVPKRVSGLGAWNGILQAVTYIGVATNALIITLTSDFVPRENYRYEVNSQLIGYVNSTLSIYETVNFARNDKGVPKICYYSGKRYPPDHPNKYQLTDAYWYEIALKFIAIVIFEHLIFGITGILAYAIPDIPLAVKEHLNYEQYQFKELRMRVLNDAYYKERKSVKNKSKRFFSELFSGPSSSIRKDI